MTRGDKMKHNTGMSIKFLNFFYRGKVIYSEAVQLSYPEEQKALFPAGRVHPVKKVSKAFERSNGETVVQKPSHSWCAAEAIRIMKNFKSSCRSVVDKEANGQPVHMVMDND